MDDRCRLDEMEAVVNPDFARRQLLLSSLATILPLASAAGLFLPSTARAAKSDKAPINALVIGASYATAPAQFHLANAVPDAELVARFLQQDPARKIILAKDPDRAVLADLLTGYLDGLQSSDIAFIYFAGHGVQVDGANYIVSGDGFSLIPIGDIVLRARQRAKLVLLFLDACRNNPFALNQTPHVAGARAIDVQRLQSRGLKRTGTAGQPDDGLQSLPLDSPGLLASNGLAQFRLQGRGIKVVFSTDPGNVAMDAAKNSGNSPFTLSLVKALAQPKSLDDALADVTKSVVLETGGGQTPWVQGSLEEAIFISGRPPRYNSGDVIMPMP